MRIQDQETGINLHLTAPAVRSDPYPHYAKLRGAAPLLRCKHPFIGKAWAVTRYEDVAAILKDAERFRSNPRTSTGRPGPFEGRLAPKLLRAFARSLVFVDDIDHRRLRSLVTKAFTPARVNELHRRIEKTVDDLLDEAERKGTFDLMSGLALPLPLRIISELLGVRKAEEEYFHHIAQGALNVKSAWTFIIRLPMYRNLYRFFDALLQRKRADPGDDLTSALIAAEQEGDRLSTEELMGMVFLLLFAGHETTVNLVGNGAYALLEHPEQLERLREDPSLIPTAIEEILRYYSPAHMAGARYLAEETEVCGVRLPRGTSLIPMLAAANRDETVFREPNTFDVTRDPNRHVAFGVGRHFCIGAHLTRLEGSIAFPRLLERFPRLRFANEPPPWHMESSMLRGLQVFPVSVN
ncbi:MAG: cytochrome P450 [Myxococcota bacterium]